MYLIFNKTTIVIYFLFIKFKVLVSCSIVSVLVYICMCSHSTSIRLFSLLLGMQETVCVGDACTNRQAKSTAALSSSHWNACIKNGAQCMPNLCFPVPLSEAACVCLLVCACMFICVKVYKKQVTVLVVQNQHMSKGPPLPSVCLSHTCFTQTQKHFPVDLSNCM